jgi:hypothetical protein
VISLSLKTLTGVAGVAGAAGLLLAGTSYASTDHLGGGPLVGAPVAPAAPAAAPTPDAPSDQGAVHVVLRCVVMTDATVDHCQVASETPPGHGLGEAALRMSRQIRINRESFTRDMVGQAVDIPLSFAPDAADDDMPSGVAAMPM